MHVIFNPVFYHVLQLSNAAKHAVRVSLVC